jgi:hypothetical protein
MSGLIQVEMSGFGSIVFGWRKSVGAALAAGFFLGGRMRGENEKHGG